METGITSSSERVRRDDEGLVLEKERDFTETLSVVIRRGED